MGISPEALHLLVSYSWPGNVRELENAIERGIALGVTPDIRPQDLPKALRPEKSELAEDDTYDDAADAAQSMGNCRKGTFLFPRGIKKFRNPTFLGKSQTSTD